MLDGFHSPFRYDRNRYGGGILVYVKHGVPAKELKEYQLPDDIECGFVEINIKKKKWLLANIYRPPSQGERYFFRELGKALDHFSTKFEDFILMGDFNTDDKGQNISNFMESYSLKNIVKVPTCFKSDRPKTIDLILTNRTSNFQNTTPIETGLSDFHCMIATVVKGGFIKRSPKIVNYRDYRKFDIHRFRYDLNDSLLRQHQQASNNYDVFDTIVLSVLNKHAPMKKKFIRANDGPFMTKALRKAIMRRTRLRNKYNKERTDVNRKAYKRQRNLCLKLLREAKTNYYKNLDPNSLYDNRKFWHTVKPLFSGTIKTSASVTLIENNEIISNDKCVAEIFNEYFATITNSLGIQETGKNTVSTHDVNDPVEIAITKYSSHSSIKKIRENFHPIETFEFRPYSLEEIMTQIERLDHKKACPIESIPAKVLKENSDLFLPYLSSTYNTCILENFFLTELKSGDISSLYKKDDVFNKKNYRPITVLSSVSKIFERLMYEQIIPFAECFLSPLLCGFRKGYNAQHALLKFSETCKAAIDKGGFAGALLMDLSKAFDSLNHELLLAKMYAYGFSRSALTLIHSYLSNRKQRVKINGSYSTWRETNLGVPQGSVLGPLLFNIYITDLFHLMNGTEICNYADDTTLYSCDREVKNVITKLEQNANHLITWFPENHMKFNEDKCHLIIFGTREEKVSMHVGEVQIEEIDDEKLLGITLDKKLTFKKHVQAICKKASQKLHALTRISIYMEPKKLKVLMKAFVMSQFSYCSLIWMFHDRTLNNKINRIHERALRIAYKDNVSSFENLLLMDNSVTVHQRNLQLLMIEIYKTRNNLNPSFMKQIFEAKVLPYNLRCSEKLQLPKAKTTGLGIDTVRFVGGRVWETLPTELKTSSSLKIFKRHIKSHKCDACNCRLCKKFYPNLGFLS